MTGDDNGAGSIEYDALYRLMRASERNGVITRFPHSAHVYQMLTNKEWTHQMCLNPLLRIPASIPVPRQWIERDVKVAAQKAQRMLQMVKNKQVKIGMCPGKRGSCIFWNSWMLVVVESVPTFFGIRGCFGCSGLV